MDFNIRLSNGQILNGAIKSPGEDLRAMVILVHGLGEHLRRYDLWADLFNNEKIGFAGVDLPGHGRSDGKRGHIKSSALIDEMADIILDECRKTFPGIPLFLYGHSLGGGLVLNYLITRKPKIKGAIVTSPWLKLSFEPGRFKIKLARLLGKILPAIVIPSGLVVDHLSHNSEVVEKYKADPYTHGKISLSLFSLAMNAASNALRNASDIKIPLLLMHGNDDLICSSEGSCEFASKAKTAELIIWEGGYHELHNEAFGNEVFDRILAWMNERLAN